MPPASSRETRKSVLIVGGIEPLDRQEIAARLQGIRKSGEIEGGEWVGPGHGKPARRQDRLIAKIRRHLLIRRPGQIVGQIRPRDVCWSVSHVFDLNPVVGMALRIVNPGIRGHPLADPQLGGRQ